MYLPVYKRAAFLLEYRFCSVLFDKLCCNHWRLEIQDTILSRCWSSACIPPHVPCKHLQHMEVVPYSHLTSCSLNYQELLSRELIKKAGETPWHHLVFFFEVSMPLCTPGISLLPSHEVWNCHKQQAQLLAGRV